MRSGNGIIFLMHGILGRLFSNLSMPVYIPKEVRPARVGVRFRKIQAMQLRSFHEFISHVAEVDGELSQSTGMLIRQV